jgi:GntR family transcriptional repressor for pyruvate dehydrogenase complex
MTDSLFKMIDHGTMADEAVRQIEILLLDGVLSSGDRLPSERELADQMQVSRPILRLALKELEARGLIVSRHGGGTYVADLIGQVFSEPLAKLVSRHDRATHDYLEFRCELESYAAGLAAARATDSDRERLTSIVDSMTIAFEREDFEAELNTDIALHNAIGEAAHNIILMHTLKSCYRLLSEGIFVHRRLIFALPGARQALLEQHRHIVAAILASDAETAVTAAKAHIHFVRQAAETAKLQKRRSDVARLRKLQRDTIERTPHSSPDNRTPKGKDR